MPIKNILIEDCTVSGCDAAGSVYAGKYTTDKLIAIRSVRSYCPREIGYRIYLWLCELVTVRRAWHLIAPAGLHSEASGWPLIQSDIVFTDCTMDQVSSSPILFVLR